MELSFGEQIKILLKRKNMTIKDLADLYTAQTGSPMSRQNLTQRLKRDNFPEQDMHIIAALLGYNVSIQLTPVTVQLPEFVRMEAAELTPAASPAAMVAAGPAQQSTLLPDGAVPAAMAGPAQQIGQFPDGSASAAGPAQQSTLLPDGAVPAARGPRTLSAPDSGSASGITFQIPEAFRKNRPQGEINPLTGQEYLTNTVRKHPDIEEFVQVYDQTTHSWSDVREDYFWEFQEKKKQMLGADYRAPIRI